MTSHGKSELLTEYEAASLTGMSPRLLKWLTSYAPKHGSKRKLKLAKKLGDLRYYEKSELLQFNAWLEAPWPAENGKRPRIPAGIKDEIEIEANGECALCKRAKDVCEAAHIEPVALSRNNHPRNLIWLCANHHTTFDKDLYECYPGERDIVRAQKKILAYFARTLWDIQSHNMVGGLGLMNAIAQLSEQLDTASKEEIPSIYEKAEYLIGLIPKMAPLSTADPMFNDYKDAKAELEIVVKTGSVETKLRKVKTVRAEFIAKAGYVPCPICEGSGYHDDTDCPVCAGEKEVSEYFADRFDESPYQKVDCPICDGNGVIYGLKCDACNGEQKMDRRFADAIDPNDYRQVPCPLCEGLGLFDDRDCDVCGGEGATEPQFLANFDRSDYDHLPCPVCEETGLLDGQSCRECGGEGTLQKRHREQIDLSDYQNVNCPVCDGTNSWGELNNCPACRGELQMPKHFADEINVRDYRWVECEACGGSGESDYGECNKCLSGEVMERDTWE